MEDSKDNILTNLAKLVTIPEDEQTLVDFIVDDVMNRAMIYMNRYQLKKAYDAAIAANVDEEDLPAVPFPPELEMPLTMTCYRAYKTIKNALIAETGAVKSVSDNGQSVSFGDVMASYFQTAKDSEIFAGTTELLNNFRLITVIENAD